MRVRASTLALIGAYIAACAAILYALHHGGIRMLFGPGDDGERGLFGPGCCTGSMGVGR